MQVAVVGTGNAGSALAGDLALKGHEVRLLKSSSTPLNEHQEALFSSRVVDVVENGSPAAAQLATVTTDPGAALDGADIVAVCTQTTQHDDVIRKLAPHVADGQTLLFEPGYLATALVLKHLGKREITVVEAASTPVNSRVTSPGEVRIAFRNSLSQVGVWPRARQAGAVDLLDNLGYEWTLYRSVVEAALHNPNLIVHTVGGLMSIPRIEATQGEYWMYREVFSSRVWNLVEALDGEKISVLEALGLPGIPYVDACKERNAPDSQLSSKEVFFEWAMNDSQKGPARPDSRYLTEDVPQGLVMLESLGQALGVPTPVCSALITMSGSALNVDFRAGGARTVEALGGENLKMILDEING